MTFIRWQIQKLTLRSPGRAEDIEDFPKAALLARDEPDGRRKRVVRRGSGVRLPVEVRTRVAGMSGMMMAAASTRAAAILIIERVDDDVAGSALAAACLYVCADDVAAGLGEGRGVCDHGGHVVE